MRAEATRTTHRATKSEGIIKNPRLEKASWIAAIIGTIWAIIAVFFPTNPSSPPLPSYADDNRGGVKIDRGGKAGDITIHNGESFSEIAKRKLDNAHDACLGTINRYVEEKISSNTYLMLPDESISPSEFETVKPNVKKRDVLSFWENQLATSWMVYQGFLKVTEEREKLERLSAHLDRGIKSPSLRNPSTDHKIFDETIKIMHSQYEKSDQRNPVGDYSLNEQFKEKSKTMKGESLYRSIFLDTFRKYCSYYQ